MYKKGAVILVPFPFTDLSGSKVRPAIIVSNREVGSDIVVVFLTSKKAFKGKYLVSISPNKDNGLKAKSKIVCFKLATLDTKIVLGELGTVSTKEQKQIDTHLKKIFGL